MKTFLYVICLLAGTLALGCGEEQSKARQSTAEPTRTPKVASEPVSPLAFLVSLQGEKDITLASVTAKLGQPREKIEQGMNAKHLMDKQSMQVDFHQSYLADAYYCFTETDTAEDMVDINAWRYYLNDDESSWLDVLVRKVDSRFVGWEKH